MIELMMSLSQLPRGAAPLPPGYVLRPYRSGDGDTWRELQSSTGVYGSVSAELFGREFGDRVSDLVERIMFAEADGRAVAVSAAWFPSKDVAASAGRLHWVAVRPSHQRRGLGRALVINSLWRLRELGYSTAYLTTGAQNLPAISLYRSLGFEPVPRTVEERRAWTAERLANAGAAN